MSKSLRLAVTFVALLFLVGILAYICINVSGIDRRAVFPVMAIFIGVAMSIFFPQYNAAREIEATQASGDDMFSLEVGSAEEKQPRSPLARPAEPQPLEQTAGYKFLRIVSFATLSIGAIMIVAFMVQWTRGTLDPTDVRRFIPKAAYALVLMTYILHKTKPGPKGS